MSDVMFTAQAKAKGGRDGHVTSDNGVIDLNLAMPKGSEPPADATNPEQLFAAGYAACFDGALNLVANKAGKEIDSAINAEVSLLKDPADNGFKIGVVLHVEIDGVSQDEAEGLAGEAHKVCPYSKATSGNVNVELKIKGE
ncbi:Ohr subfamily peroxiredoxin [Salsuginibacillus halophilus]|uniref:Ohr subfamily peroxiredoxin n=1 Tax=Salsuginibacillus halophilus TaxID=517424 RepID=A0A2P8H3R8_9BACI|nr:organic hydroperoxide resistance protein [Salsuginibacillus halophilus]PSL40865.1 Ohr subfamily peroxiredoxin [Salsuginibacillus halophilus]